MVIAKILKLTVSHKDFDMIVLGREMYTLTFINVKRKMKCSKCSVKRNLIFGRLIK